MNNVYPAFERRMAPLSPSSFGKLGKLPENSGFVAYAARDRLSGDRLYEEFAFANLLVGQTGGSAEE